MINLVKKCQNAIAQNPNKKRYANPETHTKMQRLVSSSVISFFSMVFIRVIP